MQTDQQVRDNIAANVRRLLSARGWSQFDLARNTGEKQQTINRICNAKNIPSAAILSRIAEAFDVSLDRLVSDSPESSAVSA